MAKEDEEIHDSGKYEAPFQHLLSLEEMHDGSSSMKREETIMELSRWSTTRPTWPSLGWVPSVLRQQNLDAYRPSTVSIGPHHCKKLFVQEMQAVKKSYMLRLFDRAGAPEKSKATEKVCWDAMVKMESNVEKCYGQLELELDVEVEVGEKKVSQKRVQPRKGSKLAEMMLIDGCFIVELLYRNYLYRNCHKKDDDSILRNPFKYYGVQHDFLLFENQIPFSVIRELFDKTVGLIAEVSDEPEPEPKPKPTLHECVLLFFDDMMGQGIHHGKQEICRSDSDPLHILHLLHSCYVPSTEDESNYEYDELPARKYCATRLDMAGVKFQASKSRDLFDMKFSTVCGGSCLCRGGVFEIPRFSIYEHTEPFLRNLISFEQCCPWVNSFFTSHAFLMDILINSARDVELLEEAGVIDSYLGSSEAVCRVFNDICKNAVPRHFLYSNLMNDVNEFCKGCWGRQLYFGTLVHNYFGNVWVRISVFAAIILFVLTLLQTISTMRS